MSNAYATGAVIVALIIGGVVGWGATAAYCV